eukprot:m.111710 g.111710  ORF g.111710 m.111710 type:complete len:517 (+) comp13457_c1_seq1:103-1653(+)
MDPQSSWEFAFKQTVPLNFTCNGHDGNPRHEPGLSETMLEYSNSNTHCRDKGQTYFATLLQSQEQHPVGRIQPDSVHFHQLEAGLFPHCSDSHAPPPALRSVTESSCHQQTQSWEANSPAFSYPPAEPPVLNLTPELQIPSSIPQSSCWIDLYAPQPGDLDISHNVVELQVDAWFNCAKPLESTYNVDPPSLLNLEPWLKAPQQSCVTLQQTPTVAALHSHPVPCTQSSFPPLPTQLFAVAARFPLSAKPPSTLAPSAATSQHLESIHLQVQDPHLAIQKGSSVNPDPLMYPAASSTAPSVPPLTLNPSLKWSSKPSPHQQCLERSRGGSSTTRRKNTLSVQQESLKVLQHIQKPKPLAQRQITVICKVCKRSFRSTMKSLKAYAVEEGKSCKNCNKFVWDHLQSIVFQLAQRGVESVELQDAIAFAKEKKWYTSNCTAGTCYPLHSFQASTLPKPPCTKCRLLAYCHHYPKLATAKIQKFEQRRRSIASTHPKSASTSTVEVLLSHNQHTQEPLA